MKNNKNVDMLRQEEIHQHMQKMRILAESPETRKEAEEAFKASDGSRSEGLERFIG